MKGSRMEIPFANQQKYILRRHEDLKKARQALAENDLSSIETLGHQWKGNGATFGFPELGKLGADLENAAAEKRKDLVSNLVSQFETWLSSHPTDSPQT
jgi:HPt (histidine-containing phosphotransfer) domain-containing protein